MIGAHFIEAATPTQAILGESPVWSRHRQRLLWVDTLAPTLNLFDPSTRRNEMIAVPDLIGFVAETAMGDLVVAQGCDLARVSPSGDVERFASVPEGGSGFRLNDAKFDTQGRLWLGLMANDLSPGSGILYRYDPDGRWQICDRGFTLVNGLDWSPDGKTLYVTDSRAGVIYAYAFEPGSGSISDRRIFIRIPAKQGFADGLTVDAEGYLLSVLFDGSAILRIDPSGAIDRKIALPVPRPTSSAFTPDGRNLYVTTARLDLKEADLLDAPLSGALLRVDYGAVREEANTS